LGIWKFEITAAPPQTACWSASKITSLCICGKNYDVTSSYYLLFILII
jgi:hypothetical protein